MQPKIQCALLYPQMDVELALISKLVTAPPAMPEEVMRSCQAKHPDAIKAVREMCGCPRFEVLLSQTENFACPTLRMMFLRTSEGFSSKCLSTRLHEKRTGVCFLVCLLRYFDEVWTDTDRKFRDIRVCSSHLLPITESFYLSKEPGIFQKH